MGIQTIHLYNDKDLLLESLLYNSYTYTRYTHLIQMINN